MRLIRTFLTTTLLLTALTGIARSAAAEAAPASAPPARPAKPPAEADALKMFVGSWTCEGTAMVGPGKAVKIKATAKVKNELGGFWQSFVYTEQKTKDYPMALTAMGTWGWDAQSRKYVRAEFQTSGGYITGTSTGWTGEAFTWDLEVSNFMGKMTSKHTFTKKGDKEFTHKLEVNMPGSPAAVPIFDVTCKK